MTQTTFRPHVFDTRFTPTPDGKLGRRVVCGCGWLGRHIHDTVAGARDEYLAHAWTPLPPNSESRCVLCRKRAAWYLPGHQETRCDNCKGGD